MLRSRAHLVLGLGFALVGLAGLACDLATEGPAELSETETETETEPASDQAPPADIPDDEASEPPALAELDLDDNQGCVDCHPDAAATWRGSLHQRAWVEPAFQRSYAREPLEFCRGCHAPRSDPALEPPPELARLGVDCVSCHVRDGAIHTGPGRARARAPHELVRRADFGEAVCADCHQFEFPRKAHRAPGTLMQKTMLEHERSEWAELTCADCHLPERDELGADGRRHRDHGLSISRNAELLQNSLVAGFAWPSPERVRFELAPNAVGHSFPTGDLFRRLELRVELLDGEGRVFATERRYLARQFESVSDGHRWIGEAPDERLSGAKTVELALPRGPEAAAIRWQVLYQRVDSRDHERPERSTLAGEVELASGQLDRALAGPAASLAHEHG